MTDIAPLTPLRYDLSRLPRGLGAVVAPPYDVISPDQRAKLAARDPHNIVRLILPEVEGSAGAGAAGGEAMRATGDADPKYAEAARLLAAWQQEGALVRDEEPAFYRHDQTFVPPGAPAGTPSIRRRGFLALVRLSPFTDRAVLPHERTLSGPKEDRLRLFRATRTNLSPGFMLYRDPRGELGSALEVAQTLAELSTDDGVQHTLAKVSRPEALRAIVAGVARSALLIADGHHRYETALRYCGEVEQAAGARALERGEHRYFMTFLVNGDDPELVVFPTHRHVHSLPSFSFDDLARRAGALFRVVELPPGAEAPAIIAALARARAEQAEQAEQAGDASGRSTPALAAASGDGRVVLLTLRPDVELAAHPILGQRPAVLRRTDVTLLHAGILEPLLGITPEAQAAKTNLWYPQDAPGALADLRSGKGNVLFLMNGTPVADVREVAEAGEVMPQKSTFFYPKIPTGLAIHTLDPARAVPA